MSFLSPGLLWAFLALIPLAALYFLKVRPRKRVTTAYFLWEKIFSEKKASSLLSRLRDLLSLLLMVLAFSAIALALSRPTFDEDSRKDLLLLVDVSASMAATDGSGDSRLEQAKQVALNIVRALNGNQRAAVATVGDEVTFVSHFTESPRALIEAVEEIKGSVFALQGESLVKFLSGRADWGDGIRVILLSDANFAGVTALEDSGVELFKIGESAENVGMINADLVRLPGGDLGLYYQIYSSYAEVVQADLVLSCLSEDGRVYKLIPLSIQPGLNEAEVFEIEGAPSGEWIAEVEIEDALLTDNRAYLSVPEDRPVKVKVDAENRYFFETSILAFEQGGGTLKLIQDGGTADVVVSQGSDSGDAPLRMVFTPSGQSDFWSEVGEEVPVAIPVAKAEDHPVLRYLDVESIAFEGARRITPPDHATVLIESEAGLPLVFQVSQAGETVLVVNMDPVLSGFYFSAWFPTLVYSASTHLAGQDEELFATNRPGDRPPIPGYREGKKSIVVDPEGQTLEVGGEALNQIADLGFYRISNQGGDWTLGSSLLAWAETDLNNEQITGNAAEISMGRGAPYWLLVLAILVLASESVLYHRRRVG